jgi:4-coumarate--CoA ligase (photoactive yellow protein activation family)
MTAAAGRETLLAPRERAATSPLALGEVPRTWGDLLADAGALAEALGAGAGVVEGREAMVACADRYFATVALLAVWQRGAVAALPPNGRAETIDRLCGERGISVILHDGGGQGESGFDLRSALGRPAGSTPPLGFPAERPLVTVYTSGSTGVPIACAKTAGQLLGEAALLARLYELGPGTRLLATVPSHHLYGLLFGILVPFMGGGAFVRTTPLHAETIAAEARARQANVVASVPAHLRGVAQLAAGALPPLRRIFSSGAPLDAATARGVAALARTPVTEVLGSSETGGIAWREAPGDGAWRPLPGIEVEPDAEGRMLVRSPYVAAGEADAWGWYRGADRIAARPDGGFDLLGRADGVVKIGGSRIALAETERLLREIPGVADAAVIAVDLPGLRRHEILAAVVAPGLEVPALRAALLRRLEPIAVPRRFRIVPALPREDNGKLVRARLLALFESPARVILPFHVPGDWKYFRGHFDDFPILAGVVQLREIVLREVNERWSDLRQLRRITGLKFRKPIAPGDDIALEIGRSGACQVTFELRRGPEVVSSGALEFAAPAAAEGPPS